MEDLKNVIADRIKNAEKSLRGIDDISMAKMVEWEEKLSNYISPDFMGILGYVIGKSIHLIDPEIVKDFICFQIDFYVRIFNLHQSDEPPSQ